MKIEFPRAAAPAAMIVCASLFTVSAFAAQPEGEQEAEEVQEQAEGATPEVSPKEIVIPEAKEEKRICRRVRLDMSSRRATNVCMTAEEWREFNQQR